MTFELCSENPEAAKLAAKVGIKRVELCSALSIGGLTPSPGLIASCVSEPSVEIHTMIRPRGGNFTYSDLELSTMLKDIEAVKKAGAQGIVFGCLTKENDIDFDRNRILLECAKKLKLEVTFHRAFDFCNRPLNTLEILIDLGFDRLLTSGQKNHAIDGIELIRELVVKASDRIQIMAGSGIDHSNAKKLSQTGVDSLHFTSHIKIENPGLGMGDSYIMDEHKAKGIVSIFQD